jgi:processive 1,2-diacylglycerol beta-glucosyltransferase
MLLVDPVPGQEEWNADHVVSMQAGVQVRLSAMVPVVVEQFLNNPGYLEVLRAGAERTGRPRAAEDIAKAVRERVQQQPS